MIKKSNKILFEAALIFIITVVTFNVAGKYDILETIVEVSLKYEQFEIDEMLTASVALVLCLLVFSVRRFLELIKSRKELNKANEELSSSLAELKVLRGIIPICSYCNKICDDEGLWQRVDVYLKQRSGAAFSHGICPECDKKFIQFQ